MNRLISFAFVLSLLYAAGTSGWASISIHPSSLRLAVPSESTRDTILHVTNIGPSSSLGYSITENIEWLTAAPLSGQIAKGDTVDVRLTVDATNLAMGTYNATLSVDDPHHGQITIPIELTVDAATGVNTDADRANPLKFSLEQNYPNPFNPATDIRYSLSDVRKVSLKVYDVLGREVATLVDEVKQPGEHQARWDASGFASGMYFYRLQTSGFSSVRRMVLLR